MTDQELLQQAKDQVAEEMKFDGWEHLVSSYDKEDYEKRGRGVNVMMNALYQKVALQAIQRAREEAKPKWISVKDSLPKKPGIKSYEHVPCNVYVPHWGVLMLMWNCEHECWDDESGDDVSSYNSSVTHWMPAPEEPKLTAPGR